MLTKGSCSIFKLLTRINFSLLYRQMSRQRRQSNPIRQLTINARVSIGKLNTNKPSTYSARCPAVCILQSRQNKLHSQKPQNSKSLWIISCLQIWLLEHSKKTLPSLFPAVTATRHCTTCSTRASICFLFRITFHGNLPASRHHSQSVPGLQISIVEILPHPIPDFPTESEADVIEDVPIYCIYLRAYSLPSRTPTKLSTGENLPSPIFQRNHSRNCRAAPSAN